MSASLSTTGSGATTQPILNPGLTVLERLPRYKTFPAVSTDFIAGGWRKKRAHYTHRLPQSEFANLSNAGRGHVFLPPSISSLTDCLASGSYKTIRASVTCCTSCFRRQNEGEKGACLLIGTNATTRCKRAPRSKSWNAVATILVR